jgi:very-short-patch-repair endonuclease
MDLSGVLPYTRLRRAVSQALSLGQVSAGDLVTSHHRGAKLLRRVLAESAPTRNEYEDVVFAVLRQAGLPRPLANTPYLGYVPDFRWPEHRVILEADSRRWHGNLVARADDAVRQAVLEAAGELVVRTTWHELTTRPDRVVARVEAALATRGWRTSTCG